MTVFIHRSPVFLSVCQVAGPADTAADAGHTFAMNSLIAGDDVKSLQDNLGHYSAAFTLDQYGHVVDSMKKASAERMQAFIDNLVNV